MGDARNDRERKCCVRVKTYAEHVQALDRSVLRVLAS
jgi:hypothetical protein